MTYHGTGRATLENAMERAIRRDAKRKEINTWHAKKQKHIRDPEAYAQAVAENMQLGLKPKHRTHEEVMLKCWSHNSKKSVSVSGVSAAPEVCERELAEQRMMEAIKQAIDLLSFHLTALSHIPNPSHKFRNRVHQQPLFDLVHKLAHTVVPPLPTPFNEPVAKPRVPLIHSCINCDGPASTQHRGYWYCEDCAPYGS